MLHCKKNIVMIKKFFSGTCMQWLEMQKGKEKQDTKNSFIYKKMFWKINKTYLMHIVYLFIIVKVFPFNNTHQWNVCNYEYLNNTNQHVETDMTQSITLHCKCLCKWFFLTIKLI